MSFNSIFLKLLLAPILVLLFWTQDARSEHVVGGDIYWECLPSGEFVFYLKLYRDCSVQNTIITTADQVLKIDNHPDFVGVDIPLNIISETDITTGDCGSPCGSANPGDISIREYLFATDPIQLNGVPPANGYVVKYNRCCRNSVDNLVAANNAEIYYTATMYPYNGQNMYPCYDSSPQFAEKPTSVLCSGYQLRYNSDAVDANLDSLSFELAGALGANGTPVAYTAGYSATAPLPGPGVNPAYDLVQLDPVSGQLEYDAPAGIQGRWTVVAAVNGWRCGQLISRTIREMSVTMLACSNPNLIPQVSGPNWITPATASGYSVTVNAGDLVSFQLSGTDNDISGGMPQLLEFTASGSQFGTGFTNANAGCVNTPCATLSNSTPPATGNGTIATTFNWQTDCNHVAVTNACATISSTYNFIFKYKDDYCPAPGVHLVNVAVTVVGEPIVDSPQPHCASTDANGDITLSWQPVTDNSVPPSFVEYAIFHSTSLGGPYQEIGSVTNIATGTYLHAAGNPVASPTTSGPNYYYIRTRSGCNDAILDAAVDTISSIYLTLTNTGSTAELNWTPVSDPPLASSNGNGQGFYQVYQEYPAGTWTQIAGTTNLSYSVPVIWCNEQVNFRVDLSDNLTCISASNVVGDILNNPAQPDPQPLDSVTVDPVTGHITVCWPPNTSLNVVQYNILLNPDAFAWIPMDTVYGYNNTCWTDTISDASSQSLWYQVYATNNCDVPGIPAGSILDNTDHHETILLEAQYDSCSITTELNWNRYWYWPEGIREYDIYTSENGSPYTKIGTTTDTVFVHEGLQATAEYCYIVRAIKNVAGRITSTSNRRCIVANVPKRPEYSYNYNTTVQPGNTGIEEYFFADSTAGYLGFEIQRGTEPDATSYLWFLPYDLTTRYYEYVDAGARPRFNSYYYRVIGVDSCEQYADTLNLSRTMLLEAEANSNRTNSLQWNAYEGWRGGVTAYNIYRSVDGPFEYLRTVPPTQLTLTDSIQEIIIGEGNFCYYIEAVEGIGDPVGPIAAPPAPVQFMELSRSNEACARQHPNVFMPNAFMPEGVNNIFKPVTVYVQADSYLFQIYNRWGQRIFETTDPNEGWNGSHSGKEDPQGAYVYYVSFVSSNGETYSKSGSVTLIR